MAGTEQNGAAAGTKATTDPKDRTEGEAETKPKKLKNKVYEREL